MTARAVEQALKKCANPERVAVLSGGYSPSALRYVGASVPQLRGIVRDVAAAMKGTSAAEVLALAQELVDGQMAEARQVGWEVVAKRKDAMALLTTARLERLGRGNDNWVSVDAFATGLVGPAWRVGQVADADVLRWARSRDKWWRRTALAATVALNLAARGGRGDVPRTLLVCACFTADRDPMLAKALSWALRSALPHDSDAVRAFVETHRVTLPPLVVREVTTKLTTGLKQPRAAARSKQM